MEWKNTTEFDGKTYINLGKTFSTNIEANKGDIITCEVLELIPDEEKKELAWLGARVVDVDKTRKTPYTAAQAIDIAKRGQVLQKSTQDIVPSRGPKNAKLAFVGASPGRVEAARGEPFTGPGGETFKELYLKPLGLKPDEVFLTNAVPLLLTDEKGRVREPTDEEIAEWRGWLMQELDKANPQIVMALGRKAKSALGDRADFVLPHPIAVRRFGDSGEVARKIKQIRRALEQVKKTSMEDLVEEAYAKSMKKFGAPVERYTIRKIASHSGRFIFRVNDGWGQRYYIVEGNEATPIAVKMPDVGAFHFEEPLKDAGFDKAWVKEHGFGDATWDRALAKWLEEDAVQKADRLGEEGDTRAEIAEKFWKENWHKMYPPDGKGRFCLDPKTPVLLEDGQVVPISKVKVGDILYDDGRFTKVEGVYRSKQEAVVEITIRYWWSRVLR